jgi:hypothetical protein
MHAEDFLNQAFRPGAVTETKALKDALPPEQFAGLVERQFEQDYRAATVNGRFDAPAFAKRINDYEASGQLADMVDPARRQGMLALAQKFSAQPGMAANILGKVGTGLAIGSGLAIPYGAEHMGTGQGQFGIPGLLGGGLAALSLLTPTGRRVMGAMLPQAAAQTIVRSPELGRAMDAHIQVPEILRRLGAIDQNQQPVTP